MKKYGLLKEIVASDFLMVSRQNNTRVINSTVALHKGAAQFGLLDLVTVNKEVKYFIKTLSFIKKKGGLVSVLISDPFIFELLSKLIKEAGLNNRILVIDSTQHLKKADKAQALIVLDSFFYNKNFFPRAFEKAVNLITIFEAKKVGFFGAHVVSNDIEGFNKIIFFFLLLKHVYNAKN